MNVQTSPDATYRLIFDAATVRYAVWDWLFPAVLFVAFGITLVCFPDLYGRDRRRFTRPFGALLAAVAAWMAVGSWRATNSQRARVVDALRAGRYQLVQGVVQNFRPGDVDSHPPEEFTVAGHRYQYAPAEHLFGFNRVAAQGGPIREGLRVRIADVDGLIAWLEVSP